MLITILLYPHARSLVLQFYRWTTSYDLIFRGKYIISFEPVMYFSGFGIYFLVTALDTMYMELKESITRIFLGCLAIIFFTLFICLIDVNVKVRQCITCPDTVRYIQPQRINHALILSVAALLASSTHVIRLVHRWISIRRSQEVNL